MHLSIRAQHRAWRCAIRRNYPFSPVLRNVRIAIAASKRLDKVDQSAPWAAARSDVIDRAEKFNTQ